MRNFRLSFIGVACGSLILGFALPTLAQGTPSTKELLERVETLTRKVQILEQRLELERQSATARPRRVSGPQSRRGASAPSLSDGERSSALKRGRARGFGSAGNSDYLTPTLCPPMG